MGKTLILVCEALLLFLWVLPGCSAIAPEVKVAPLTLEHSTEVVKGTGDAEGYWVLADRRVYSVMAFLNAVGYDEEVQGKEMHPIRVKVRSKVAKNLAGHPEKLATWRQYYQERLLGSWQYVNFALSLSADYPFKRIRPDEELSYPWTTYRLVDLPEVLNEFWVTARLDRVWEECRADYRAEIDKYSVERMARQMTTLWRYLRMQRPDDYIVIQVPDPLRRHSTAFGNRFEVYFYSVDGPSSNDGGLNVHEYLHTFINDLVEASYSSQEGKLRKYFDAGKSAEISSSYQDLVHWISECFVHAIDSRVAARLSSDVSVVRRIEAQVDKLTHEGYKLLKPLYAALTDFEQTALPFDQYLPTLLQKLPDYSG